MPSLLPTGFYMVRFAQRPALHLRRAAERRPLKAPVERRPRRSKTPLHLAFHCCPDSTTYNTIILIAQRRAKGNCPKARRPCHHRAGQGQDRATPLPGKRTSRARLPYPHVHGLKPPSQARPTLAAPRGRFSQKSSFRVQRFALRALGRAAERRPNGKTEAEKQPKKRADSPASSARIVGWGLTLRLCGLNCYLPISTRKTC